MQRKEVYDLTIILWLLIMASGAIFVTSMSREKAKQKESLAQFLYKEDYEISITK